MTAWFLVAAGIALTLGTGVFVAAEFSLVALDRATVTRLADSGDVAARPVARSLGSLSTQLSGAQVGITLTTLAVGYLVQPSLGSLLVGPLQAAGLSPGGASGAATTLAMVLATVFSMIVGELVPQFLGISAPLPTAKVVAVPVQAVSLVFKPVIWLLNGTANAVLRRWGIEPQEELSSARTAVELTSLVRRSAETGTIEEDTATLLTRTLRFGDRVAADVMTPRVDCVSVERGTSAEDVVQLARRTGHSRFPVLGDDWDDVLGIVHIKSAIAVPADRRGEVPASGIMRPAVRVPETIELEPLLLELRTVGYQLAVVLDEYGGTSGLVTLEDVVEEIVGEVQDEHDRGATTARERSDGSWSVPGMWRPDQVRIRLQADVPDSSTYETVGGFVMARLGRVPEVGDTLALGEWEVSVADMVGRRVERLTFRPVSTALPGTAETSASAPPARPSSRGTGPRPGGATAAGAPPAEA